jgi:hypothetical protein
MHPNLEISKLTALRVKTDRELVVFMKNRLDSAMEFARLQDLTSRDQARQIYEEVCELLPFAGACTQDRRRIEATLERLAVRLGVSESPRVMTMCG